MPKKKKREGENPRCYVMHHIFFSLFLRQSLNAILHIPVNVCLKKKKKSVHAEQVAWSQSYAARKAIRRTDVAVHRSHESTQLYNELVFVLHFFMLNSVPVGFILNVRSIIRSTTQNIRKFNTHTEKLFGNAGPPPSKKKKTKTTEKKKKKSIKQ